ncbi:MAG: DNA adenine methylase [Phycisphaerae bacterium]|nr:DNA adenine methylase [Phycisphaerae bacterium]NIS53315.1 DNA adenine methylase [Phycisphaerae bacterium]NIX30469.1 DNA adenine methylase [Phycisphaerae bacterium]
MKIKAIAPWFGGKRRLAPLIADLLGRHRAYWEPFCGSMAVLFAKKPCEMETVNDLHGDLINLARIVQDKELGFKLYDKLSRTLYAEQFFREAKKRWLSAPRDFDAAEPDIDRAYDYFVASWLGINGVSGTERCNYQFALRWCVGGGQGAIRWTSVIESMPAWHKRLRNVVIIQRDAFEIIENIKDKHHTAVYCDPPYIEKSDKYVHDFNENDHQRLAQALQRFEKARVIVSYYDHPKLETLYEGFEKITVTGSRQSLRNATREKKKKARIEVPEVLLINGPASNQMPLFK